MADRGKAAYSLAKSAILRRENKASLLGDSITRAQSVINTATTGEHMADRGWFTWANAFLGQAFDVVKNAGVSGNRTDQMLARLDADIISYNPAWCFVLGGINDLMQSITADAIFSSLQAIYERLAAANIRVVALTVGPTASLDTVSKKEEYYKLNRKIKAYGRSNPGVIVIDIASVIANPADTTANAGTVNADLLHWSANGSCRIGEYIANEMRKHVAFVPPVFSNSKDDPTNLIGNGVMYGTTGQLSTATGVCADGWVLTAGGGAAVVGSKVTRTDFPGEWQRATVSGGGATGYAQLHREITTGFTPLRTVQATWEINFDPAAIVTERLDALIEFRNSGSTVIDTIGLMFHESANPNLNYTPKGVLILKSQPFVIPATAAKTRLSSKAVMTSGIIDFGRVELIEVT